MAGTDIILTWYALDNISSSLPFLVPQIEEGVATGTMTKEEAIGILEEAEFWFDAANTKAKISSIVNPLLWPSSKLIRGGADLKKLEYDVRKANFLANF